jgi:hypothetical protein
MKTWYTAAALAVALVLALVTIAPPTAAQQCPKRIGNPWYLPLGQEPYRVEVAGSYAYLWDAIYSPFLTHIEDYIGWRGGHVNVIDISDPEGPRIVADLRLGSVAFDASGHLMFIITSDGLTITDVSDPAEPVVVSTWNESVQGRSLIAVSGDYALIPNSEGLVILDIGDPTNPFEVGGFIAEWQPTHVVVDGDSLFVAVPGDGVRIIDTSDPTNPYEVGAWQTASTIQDLAASGGFAYVACGIEGLRVIDATKNTAPVDLGVFDTVEEAWGVSVSGFLATVALGRFGVGVYDVANPRRPEMLAAHATEAPVWDVALSTETIYVAAGLVGEEVPPLIRDGAPPYGYVYGGFGGFRALDVSSPRWPTELASFSFERTARDVAVKDGLQFIALGDLGITRAPAPDPLAPPPAEFDTPGVAVGITLTGRYALVADLHKGLRIIDVSDTEHMVEVGYVDTPGQSYEIAVSGDYAYVADGDSGLRVINISSPMTPMEVGAIDTPGNAIGVAVSDGFAYVADAEEGLRIIDVSNPSHPAEVSAPRWIADARAVAVAGNRACVVSRYVFYSYGGFTQLRVLDISDPTDPRNLGPEEITFRGDPTDLALSGSFAYVTTTKIPGIEPGGVEIIDLSDPRQLQRVGFWEGPGEFSALRVTGGNAYIAAGEGGVPILDVRCLTTYWVDIVAHQPGLYESEWRTDIIINNEHRRRDVFFNSESSDPYTVEFILHTGDGVITSEGAIVQEGQGVYEDIVGMLGYNGIGALEIRTDVPATVSSRIYTDTGNGTFGALSVAYRTSDCLGRFESGWLYGLRQLAGEYRTNISVTNTGTEPVGARVTLYRTDGRYLMDYYIGVAPGRVVQDLQPFKARAQQPNIGWGFAKVEGEGILASASVIDSRTNDSVVVKMVR